MEIVAKDQFISGVADKLVQIGANYNEGIVGRHSYVITEAAAKQVAALMMAQEEDEGELTEMALSALTEGFSQMSGAANNIVEEKIGKAVKTESLHTEIREDPVDLETPEGDFLRIRYDFVSNGNSSYIDEIYDILDTVTFDIEVHFNEIITLWHREFAYSFEEVDIDSLHVMMLDGRAVLSYTFGEESQVEPALVAGLFSAITSFAKEAVRSEQLLKTIDHGDVVLTIEYAKWVFAAIFADSTSTELRKKLSDYLGDFESRYSKTLPKWLGNLDLFSGETQIVDDKFSGS